MLCLTSAILIGETETGELERLIEAVAGGDTDALGTLYEKVSPSVYGFALSVLKNAHDAEDVLHDTFISVHKSAALYKGAGKPMAWLFTVAKNLCFMKLRQKKHDADVPEEDWERSIEANEAMSLEDKAIVSECMKALSDEERQIVLMHALYGFKHREIAKLLELPISTVLSKYNRTVKKLQKFL